MKKQLVIIIAIVLGCLTAVDAQPFRRKFGFRMNVLKVVNLTDGTPPFSSLTIKANTGEYLSSTKDTTFVCSNRFIPRKGMSLGTEFLLASCHSLNLNANLEIMFQGDPGEVSSTSKWIAVRAGLSTNIKLVRWSSLNLKVGYSALESNFYTLYDGDTLSFLKLKEPRLSTKEHKPADPTLTPSYVAFKQSSGFSSGLKNHTFSLDASLRFYFSTRLYVDAGASLFYYTARESAIYVSGFVNDGRVNKNNHDLPQGYRDFDSNSPNAFEIKGLKSNAMTNGYMHIGFGLSLFRDPDNSDPAKRSFF